MNTMNEIIADRRKELGMTQKELAEKMHVTDKAVSKWERGVACPDVASIPRLAEVLGITVGDLMNAQPAEPLKDNEVQKVVDTILKVIPLAMGAAVTVLSAMGKLDVNAGFGLLGIGLFCVGLRNLQEK